jgi:hypothetical protein
MPKPRAAAAAEPKRTPRDIGSAQQREEGVAEEAAQQAVGLSEDGGAPPAAVQVRQAAAGESDPCPRLKRLRRKRRQRR